MHPLHLLARSAVAMLVVSSSRAFAFAIAAYNAPRVPPRNLRQARFGGARVIYLDAPEAAPASCDSTLQADYMPLAFN